MRYEFRSNDDPDTYEWWAVIRDELLSRELPRDQVRFVHKKVKDGEAVQEESVDVPIEFLEWLAIDTLDPEDFLTMIGLGHLGKSMALKIGGSLGTVDVHIKPVKPVVEPDAS